jgi:poly-gamma-glutamate capsule biosynthesis protein CapA/YwtB (metallophosphatase superfamily)
MRLRPLGLLGLLLTVAALAQPRPPQGPGPQARITFALAGDAILTRRVLPFDHPGDPGFSGLVRLVRGADAAIVNLEESLLRFPGFRGWAEAENGGNWEVAPPEMANELQGMGFDMVACANNHTMDFGAEGLRETSRVLDRLGLPHAGSGSNLGEASRPAYLETAKGRVALVSLTTSFPPMARAGNSRPDMAGRPGANAVRLHRTLEVDATTFETLRQLAPTWNRTAPPKPDVTSFRISDTAGSTEVRLSKRIAATERVDATDQARILREITNAARLADFVVVSIHSHQPGNYSQEPPDWMKELTRACIDAGGAMVAIHGPHQLRGIEIYKDKPILYSIGNLFLQTETIDPAPADRYESAGLGPEALVSDYLVAKKHETTGFPSSPKWYESVLALPTFEQGVLTELRLAPLDLGQKLPLPQRGTARLAQGERAKAILERLQGLCKPFGTTFTLEGGMGVWRRATPPVPPPAP